MARKLRSAIELVSDIGAKAFDLQHHNESDIREAIAVLRSVNGPMFDWLVRTLGARELREWAQHKATCLKGKPDSITIRPTRRTIFSGCTCGLDAALAVPVANEDPRAATIDDTDAQGAYEHEAERLGDA